MTYITNAIGREVISQINGEPAIPFQGIGKFKPKGKKHGPSIASSSDYPSDGDKRVGDLREALERSGLRDGMTISTHHHFRNGDFLANMVFDIAHEMGVKGLRWFPSASFPCHAHLISYLEDGTIERIEGSMNGPLGRFVSEGGMKGTGVLRSHGGRYQAIQDGEVKIDIAIIGAPAADPFGNANGLSGDSACGLLGFALADSQYAEKVIVATDHPVRFPCYPWQIQGNHVDFVVQVEKLGDPSKIISGTTQITKSPDRLLLAELTAKFCEVTGIIQDGFSFQSGAGGTSLAVSEYFKRIMKEKGVGARFARGGSNKYLVSMLEEGLVEYILDGQTFDLEGVRSMTENPAHVWTSPFTSYNYHGKGNFAGMVDVVILGATEVDVDFNVNVNTHSDGRLLHGIGGHQDTAAGAKLTIIVCPLYRKKIPIVREKVTTITTPGETVGAIVTNEGIAINPKRKDLLGKLEKSSLPIVPIEDLKDKAYEVTGGPPELVTTDRIIALIEYRDGSIIDVVRGLEKE